MKQGLEKQDRRKNLERREFVIVEPSMLVEQIDHFRIEENAEEKSKCLSHMRSM